MSYMYYETSDMYDIMTGFGRLKNDKKKNIIDYPR